MESLCIIEVGDNMKSLVIGGSSIDTLIHVDELKHIKDDMSLFANDVVESIGGTGAGKSLCLDALGSKVTLITGLGKDTYGDKIIEYFDTTNIRFLPIETDKTTTHTNIMHDKGKRLSIFTSMPKKNPEIIPDIVDLVAESDVIFLNIDQWCKEYIPYIKNKGKKIIVDIHDYDPPNEYHQEFISIADILIGSIVNIVKPKEFMEKQIDLGKEVVVLTNGVNGLIAMDFNKVVYSLPGYTDIEYVDSNGAGDSFTAGFTYEYNNTGNIGESLKIGTICGAIACTSYDLFNRKYNIEDIKSIKKSME